MLAGAQDGIAARVELLVAKSRALAAFNMIEAVDLRPGATPEELARLDEHLGRAIPFSLRTLLAITNGAPQLLVFSDLLSVADMLPGSPAYARAEALKNTHVDGVPCIPRDALVIADKGGDQPDCVYLDPSRIGADGEWRAVTFDHEDDPIVDDTLSQLLARAANTFDLLLVQARELDAELSEPT